MSLTLLLNIEKTVFGESLLCVLYLKCLPAAALECETVVKLASKDFFMDSSQFCEIDP